MRTRERLHCALISDRGRGTDMGFGVIPNKQQKANGYPLALLAGRKRLRTLFPALMHSIVLSLLIYSHSLADLIVSISLFFIQLPKKIVDGKSKPFSHDSTIAVNDCNFL